MDAKNYWDLFIETGAPEMYLLYTEARRVDINHVFNSQRTGASDCELQ